MAMARRRAYDVDVPWDDPFEQREEHRSSKRFKLRIKVSVSVDLSGVGRSLVGPLLVENISLTGLCGVTKHSLHPGQRITIALPTDMCPVSMGMPAAFLGMAEVVRVKNLEDRKQAAAFRFDSSLSQSIEFAVFVNYLQSLAPMLSAP